jgi:hypothetical protein
MRELNRTSDELREDFNLRRNEELGKFQKQVLDVINSVAKEEGFRPGDQRRCNAICQFRRWMPPKRFSEASHVQDKSPMTTLGEVASLHPSARLHGV